MITPINFELAKLLNEKGLPGLIGFYENKKHYSLNPTKYTIADIVNWLLVKHGIWISVSIGHDDDMIWYNAYLEEVRFGYDYNPLNDDFDIVGDSPQEAYLAAIEYTLKNLI